MTDVKRYSPRELRAIDEKNTSRKRRECELRNKIYSDEEEVIFTKEDRAILQVLYKDS